MKRFLVNGVIDPDTNPFDRQNRIEWWSQEKIHNAKVMVVGAGAIGNETLKNLALLGFANIFVVDFDTVSTSNLSRTVLFRKTDVGQKKAVIAAERVRELCLVEDARIDWFHGDLVWELGTGLYREMDLVLGCLDNVETRFAVNKKCWLANTPWIDSGINELGVHVTVFIPPAPPCYSCGATREQRVAKRQRYSCDAFKRTVFQEGKMPTVQVASSIASAIQVQEAVKYLCGQVVRSGSKIYYQGTVNDFDVNSIPINDNCDTHILSCPEVVALPLSANNTLREFLHFVSQPQFSGVHATLDFKGDDIATFIISTTCRSCGKPIEFYRPSFTIEDTETVCQICQKQGFKLEDTEIQAKKLFVDEFNLDVTDNRLLGMTLKELGVPYWHIVCVRDIDDNERYYELSNDKELLLPSISR